MHYGTRFYRMSHAIADKARRALESLTVTENGWNSQPDLMVIALFEAEADNLQQVMP
jgi:hypothetical protein